MNPVLALSFILEVDTSSVVEDEDLLVGEGIGVSGLITVSGLLIKVDIMMMNDENTGELLYRFRSEIE